MSVMYNQKLVETIEVKWLRRLLAMTHAVQMHKAYAACSRVSKFNEIIDFIWGSLHGAPKWVR